MQTFIRNSLLLSLLLLIVFSAFKCGNSQEEKLKNTAAENTKYKNLESHVKYVGMTACKQCHYDKFETYIETGMGKSFDRASRSKSSAKFETHSAVYDKFSDLSYLPFWSGDSMKILEFRMEGTDTIHKRIETVDYIIGSGQHTNSHLFSTNGYIQQMPMTFYTQEKKWDLPPGFENGFNSRFSRKIGLECMSCHNAMPNLAMGSENKFSHVPNGIDCERCHGPGEIHVKEKTAGIVVDTSNYIDYSIVNPAKLTTDLQFDVCQRCHLQGNAVLKDGKSFLDFKPGMKLSDIETIFLPKYEGAEDEFIMASHADRLKMSECFVKSQNEESDKLRPHKNRLTCITCHNPHISVRSTDKMIFNTACKNCHGTNAKVLCSEQPAVRNMQQDNCVSCHMPRSGSIDIPHVTVTDHFIRKPVKKTDIARVKKFIGLVAINEKDPLPITKARAYINQFEKFDHNPALLDSAKKYLNNPKDKKFNTGDFNLLIQLYFLKNNFENIFLLNDETEWLVNKHQDAWTCYRIGEACTNLGRHKDAFAFYKKASDLAPFNLDFQNKLAGSLYNQNNLGEAKKIYEKIISENPTYAPAWCNLGVIYLQIDDLKKAMEHYNRAIALDPDYELALINKAGILIYEKKKTEAHTIIKRILKKNPKSEQALALQKQVKKI